MGNYDAPKEVRELEKLIISLAYKSGADVSQIFDDFLRYIIHGFSPGEKPLEDWKYKKEQTVVFYHMYAEWTQIVSRKVNVLGWYDAFGELYMSCIAGNTRKKSNGQFFVPNYISDFMTMLCGVQDESADICSEPACGSGRNLLAWHVKHLGSYLCAEDIDRTCCMMTVCNLLIHGGVGEVIWHDSLDPESFYDGWKVNEVLTNSGLPTVRRITKEESVVWQSWQNRKDETKELIALPPKIVSMKDRREEAKKLQLNLFD